MLFLFGTALCAQSGLQQPSIGMLRDSGGALRTVWGITGSFSMGDPAPSPVVSVYSAGARTFLKDAISIQILAEDGSSLCAQDANDGPAKASFSRDAKQAAIFLPNDGIWLLWRESDCSFQTLDVAIDGDVRDIGLNGAILTALVVRDDRVWRIQGLALNWSERREEVLDGVTPMAALTPDGAVIWYDQGVIWRRLASGEEQSIDFGSGVAGYSAFGRGWLAISSTDGSLWALRTNQADLQLFMLPGGQE